MFKLLLKYKWYMFFILILMIIEPSINSFLNFWLQKLFNVSVPGIDKIYILRLLTLGFLLWIAKRLVSFFNGVLKARYICNAKLDIKAQMFVNLFHKDVCDVITMSSSGEYISHFTNDLSLMEQRYIIPIINLLSAIFSILILGSSFIILNAKLAIAILISGLIAMLIPIIFSEELNKKNLKYSDTISKFTQNIKEFFASYPTVKNYSIEQAIIKKFLNDNSEVENAKFEADYILTLANNVGSLIAWFMQFIAVGIGLMLVIKGEVLIGTVVASQSFANDLAGPLQEIIININSIRSVKDIIKKLRCLTNSDNNSTLTSVQCSPNETSKCDIVFENFSLNIDGAKIIDNFNFNFECGKKYLVIGVNGSGKTTLFKALKKWFNDYSGSIFINNQNIQMMTNKEISKMVSYLNENIYLFSCSIRDNISLFRDYTSKEFKIVVNNTQLNIDLEREIVDEGRNISSGEQRRIEIARSLLESVPAIIFDEVISTLDIETAYKIEKLALELKEKTIIFISHNFSGKLINKYDEILVMEKGILLAHGTYEELLQSCEYFKKICQIKFGENENDFRNKNKIV